MSLRNEGAFWAKLRGEFKSAGGILKKLPAEGFAGKGTPDGAFAHRGAMGVVELKYVRRWPKRATTPIGIEVTPWQWNWLTDWVRIGGGRGFVLVGVADDWFILRVHELESVGPPTEEHGFRVSQKWLRERARPWSQGQLSTLNEAVIELACGRATA